MVSPHDLEYLTKRDMARLQEAEDEVITRPDIVSITVRLDNGDTRKLWMQGRFLLTDCRPSSK